MKNDMLMAKKFAASKTTTRTENRNKNTPVRLVIFVLAGLGLLDKNNHIILGGAELVPLLADNLNSYIGATRSRRSVLNLSRSYLLGNRFRNPLTKLPPRYTKNVDAQT
jgi:hypothetical protein